MSAMLWKRSVIVKPSKPGENRWNDNECMFNRSRGASKVSDDWNKSKMINMVTKIYEGKCIVFAMGCVFPVQQSKKRYDEKKSNWLWDIGSDWPWPCYFDRRNGIIVALLARHQFSTENPIFKLAQQRLYQLSESQQRQFNSVELDKQRNFSSAAGKNRRLCGSPSIIDQSGGNRASNRTPFDVLANFRFIFACSVCGTRRSLHSFAILRYPGGRFLTIHSSGKRWQKIHPPAVGKIGHFHQ